LICVIFWLCFIFFFQAEDGIRDATVTGVQTCALPIFFAATFDTGGARTPDPALTIAAALHDQSAFGCGLPEGLGDGRDLRERLRSEERRVGKEGRWRGRA